MDLSRILFDSTILIAVLTAAWKVVRASDRVVYVLRDFPPHRHVNGQIVYPEGYQPTASETLQVRQ